MKSYAEILCLIHAAYRRMHHPDMVSARCKYVIVNIAECSSFFGWLSLSRRVSRARNYISIQILYTIRKYIQTYYVVETFFVDIIIVISGIVYLVDLRRPENEIYLVSKSRASFFFVLLLVSIFRLFFLLFFIVFPFSLFFFFLFHLQISWEIRSKLRARIAICILKQISSKFSNDVRCETKNVRVSSARTVSVLQQIERLFNASAFNFLDFLFLFFSFYIVGEVLYQRIADFNLRNPTNHFYEWTIFDLFTRVISMRYFKRIEREVLMSTFFLRSLRSILSFTYFVRSHKKQ